MNQDGILVVNKPAGMTSHDVVQKLRRAYNIKKVGHTGTLDPMVTGVLVVCFGRATKLAQFLTDESKCYYATAKLGISTETEDITGNIVKKTDISLEQSTIIKNEIANVIKSFKGTYTQIPPMYSAIKVNGKKLYEYARQNIEVERASREINIFDIVYDAESFQYNEDRKTVSCSFTVYASKGLYARTLCVDIGEKLGFPATMEALVRLQSGSYTLEQAIDLSEIIEQLPPLISIDEVELPMEKVFVAKDIADKLKVGYKLPHYFVEKELKPDEVFTVYNEENNELIGIYTQSEKYADKYKSIRIM